MTWWAWALVVAGGYVLAIALFVASVLVDAWLLVPHISREIEIERGQR